MPSGSRHIRHLESHARRKRTPLKRNFLQLAFQVKCAKWDPPHKRDFAFVRCLKRPKRSADSAFSLLEVEKCSRGDDADVTEKLGKLWTWDNSVRGGQYKVLPVEKILHSLPLMPRFKPNSCEYSIDKGICMKIPSNCAAASAHPSTGAGAGREVRIKS